MSSKLIDLYRKAETDLLDNNLEDALAGFCTIVKNDPDHIWSRFQIGHALEKMNKINRAFQVYKSLAWHCTKAGYPLLGIDATKRAENLQAGAQDTLEIMAELYGLESDRVDQELNLFSPPEIDAEQATDQNISADDEKLDIIAEQAAKSFDDARYPKQLPPIPLFSLLSVEAFFPILEILTLRTYKPGETIINQGDPGTSIYLLAHGEIEIHEGKDQEAKTLARLVSGSVFGEMALITDAPREASAIALRESDIIELPLAELEAISEDIDDITWAVAKFTRQRFLNHLMATSPIFAPFSPPARKEIFDRFTSAGVPTGEVIIKEGSAGPGLYLILGGEVEVSRFEGDSQVHLARLEEGSVFGEISLIHDSPTTATVTASRGGEFLFLPKEEFQDLVEEYPEIKDSLKELSEERINEQKQAISIATDVSEDGSVMF
jgi:CRP-like cAMP-binding protein